MPLSLLELEAFDPQSRLHGKERRFCCPLPSCLGKPINSAHRSLSVNIETGAYHCHRCGDSGFLEEHTTERSKQTRREYQRAKIRKFTALPPEKPIDLENTSWKRQLTGITHLEGTPGEEYLKGRGIPLQIAHISGVRFAQPYGCPAVVFPVKDAIGKVLGFNARVVDGSTPKARSGGHIGRGVFATLEAWNAPCGYFVLCEAPIDALSLDECGFPAIALCGTAMRDWLVRRLAMKDIRLAFDNDTAGDRAAEDWCMELERFGCRVSRLRPPEGHKDWNDFLYFTHKKE